MEPWARGLCGVSRGVDWTLGTAAGVAKHRLCRSVSSLLDSMLSLPIPRYDDTSTRARSGHDPCAGALALSLLSRPGRHACRLRDADIDDAPTTP